MKFQPDSFRVHYHCINENNSNFSKSFLMHGAEPKNELLALHIRLQIQFKFLVSSCLILSHQHSIAISVIQHPPKQGVTIILCHYFFFSKKSSLYFVILRFWNRVVNKKPAQGEKLNRAVGFVQHTQGSVWQRRVRVDNHTLCDSVGLLFLTHRKERGQSDRYSLVQRYRVCVTTVLHVHEYTQRSKNLCLRLMDRYCAILMLFAMCARARVCSHHSTYDDTTGMYICYVTHLLTVQLKLWVGQVLYCPIRLFSMLERRAPGPPYTGKKSITQSFIYRLWPWTCKLLDQIRFNSIRWLSS